MVTAYNPALAMLEAKHRARRIAVSVLAGFSSSFSSEPLRASSLDTLGFSS
jgi:hypothetical protein